MTRYTVHLYREMRITFENVEAATPEAAAAAADRQTLETSGYENAVHDCEGATLAALVDVVGDEGFERSRMIDFEAGRQLRATPKLLDALSYLLDQTVDADLRYGIGLSEGEADAREQALAAIAEAVGA